MPEQTDDLLLTAAEIQEVTNRPMPDDIATAIAKSATAAVRDYCGWRVAKTATETITVSSRGTRSLFLPTLHIDSITSITDGDTILTVDDFDWSEDGIVDRLRYPRWQRGRRSVRITMTHGYAECPGGIAQAIAAAVGRGVFVPAGGIVAESAIGQSFTYSKTPGGIVAGAAFSPDELERLEPHRIRSLR